MKRKWPTVFLCLTIAFGIPGLIRGDEGDHHIHTHVGRNQDSTWGTPDDDQMWFFSMPGTPGWPEWGEPLPLVYNPFLRKWVCEVLDCWHSAHPDHGLWQLGGSDAQVEPGWQIGIERITFSDGFMMLDEDTLQAVLVTDGDNLIFNRIWMPDRYSEDNSLGAWGFHIHTLFAADAAGPGEVFTATFVAHDFGSTGYISSAPCTLTFQTVVPEPATLGLLSLGLGTIVLRRRRATD